VAEAAFVFSATAAGSISIRATSNLDPCASRC
jgi:hypothetical protein